MPSTGKRSSWCSSCWSEGDSDVEEIRPHGFTSGRPQSSQGAPSASSTGPVFTGLTSSGPNTVPLSTLQYPTTKDSLHRHPSSGNRQSWDRTTSKVPAHVQKPPRKDQQLSAVTRESPSLVPSTARRDSSSSRGSGSSQLMSVGPPNLYLRDSVVLAPGQEPTIVPEELEVYFPPPEREYPFNETKPASKNGD